MANGWHEIPLVIFTVLSQCVVGTFSILVYQWYIVKNNLIKKKVIIAMLALWVLMSMAFMASTFHLGSPLRALNSLNRIGYSALSNEIAAGSLFFGLSVLWWGLNFFNIASDKFVKPLAFISVILGYFFLYLITQVYASVPTIPTWFNIYTPLSFFITICIIPPIFSILLLNINGIKIDSRKYLYFTLLFLFISMAITFLQWDNLKSIQTSAKNAYDLLPDGQLMIILRYLIATIGILFWVLSFKMDMLYRSGCLFISLIFLLVSELINRFVFYSLYMTVGLV